MTRGSNVGVRQAHVIGAGAVGVATALYLQRDGLDVTVVDPLEPAARASFGNAGLMAVNIVNPIAMPGTLARVPAMLLTRDSPLSIRWRYLPSLLPWLTRFVLASRPTRVAAIAAALAGLLARAGDAYRPLLDSAAVASLVRHRGLIVVYADERRFRADAAKRELQQRHGIELEVLAGPALRQLAPALGSDVAWGVFYPDTDHIVDPARMLRGLADDFARKGGKFVRDRVAGFELGPRGVTGLRGESGNYQTDLVVLAAGAWSRPLARSLGSSVPLDTERGYHVMLPRPGVELRLPVISGEAGFAMTPMAQGLRLAGTVEFAGLEAPPARARQRMILRQAQHLLPGLSSDEASYWMGHRPSLPDSLPVIGRAPRQPNAYFAFGHGHLGLTLAGITGRLVADQVAGRPPELTLAPYGAERFRALL